MSCKRRAARPKPVIARALNAKGKRNHIGNPWSYQTVRAVLENEKYLGHSIYGKDSKLLGGKQVANHKSLWVRKDHAWGPIVTQEVFDAAQRSRRAQITHMSDDEVIERIWAIYEREGTISAPMITAEPGLLSAQSCARCLRNLLGLKPWPIQAPPSRRRPMNALTEIVQTEQRDA